MDEPSEPISSGSSQFSYSSVPMAGLPLAGAMFGLCLGGPVGLLAGVKLGGVAAVGGSILGYTGASVIKEQREIRNHIDDHYKNDPDLFVRTPRQEAAIHRRRLSEQTPRELQGIFQDWEEQEQYQGEDQQDIGDNQEQIYWFPEV